MDNKKILIIGAGHSMDGKSRYFIDMLMHYGYDIEYMSPGMEAVGRKPDMAIFDDFSILEDRMLASLTMPGGRGSAKSMIRTEYLYKMAFPPRVGADQVKGPKGPRGKWGKLT